MEKFSEPHRFRMFETMRSRTWRDVRSRRRRAVFGCVREEENGLARDVVEEEGAKEEEEEDMRTAKFTFKATTRVPEDASAEMLTKIHVDCRFRFERALNMFGGNREAMLAEQQLAYVLFFTFGCGKGLEQWKGVDSDYRERYGRVYEGRGGEEDW